VAAPIKLIVFAGGFNWPVWVAEEKGFFAAHRVGVTVTPTPGSVYQLTHLIDGTFDVAITLLDNVIAYRSGQGEAPVTGPDLCGFLAADSRAFPTLVTAPDVKRYADLRGRTLSVDALTTGYAFVLLAMLEKGGLKESDYTLERVGGVQQRYQCILENKHAGSLFNSPFETLLQARGCNVLDTAISVLGRYQGHVAAARRGWIQSNRESVTGFVRAFLSAVNWLYEPANLAEAFSIFRRHTPHADENAAAGAHAILFHRTNGFPRDGALDVEGAKKVIELRACYGRPPAALGEPADYFDSSFLPRS
jgi:ABC-type nitrate/sulfonate/bicarbonate transport system substrate-binding protein